jgi:hypothetical protein
MVDCGCCETERKYKTDYPVIFRTTGQKIMQLSGDCQEKFSGKAEGSCNRLETVQPFHFQNGALLLLILTLIGFIAAESNLFETLESAPLG